MNLLLPWGNASVAKSSSNKCSALPAPYSALQCNSSRQSRETRTTGQEEEGLSFCRVGTTFVFTLPANPLLQGSTAVSYPSPGGSQVLSIQYKALDLFFSSDTGLEVCEVQQFREFNPTQVPAEETERPKVSSHTLIFHLSNTAGCRDPAVTFVSPRPQINIHEKLILKSQF